VKQGGALDEHLKKWGVCGCACLSELRTWLRLSHSGSTIQMAHALNNPTRSKINIRKNTRPGGRAGGRPDGRRTRKVIWRRRRWRFGIAAEADGRTR
jgi:hypothetical protein